MCGIIAGSACTFKSCYYLDGVAGTTGLLPRANEILFYQTSNNPEDMTTLRVVAALNNYIELKGVLQQGDTEIDTKGWCKWIVGSNNLPALDFNTEWNGTQWITMTN